MGLMGIFKKRAALIFSIAIVVLLFTGSYVPALSAETSPSYFPNRYRHLSSDDGLTDNSVSFLFQDSKGFLWVGTHSGLNRYDGSEVTNYYYQIYNESSISNNFITSILEDSEGYMWIGTLNGLNKLDPETNEFTRYLYEINPSSNSGRSAIRSIALDDQGNIWVGTYGGGLINFDPNSEDSVFYTNTPGDSNSLSDDFIRNIFIDSKGDIWVGTYTGGLNVLDPDTGTIKNYMNEYLNPKSISNNYVLSIIEDSSGYVWAGTEDGLNKLDSETGEFTRYLSDSEDPNSLCNDFIRKIIEDRDGNIWIGTQMGLNVLNDGKQMMACHLNNPFDSYSISGNFILSILQDRDGNIWVGTREAGLNLLEIGSSNIKYYYNVSSNENSLSNNYVISIEVDDTGCLWIGTQNGLNKLNPGTEQFIRYYNDLDDENSLNDNFIRYIFKDKNGGIWVGTYSGGLNRYDSVSGYFYHYTSDSDDPNTISSNFVRAIVEDEQGFLWIGTNKGLNKFDPLTGISIRYSSIQDEQDGLSGANITSLCFDDGYLWIGTQNGLYKLNLETWHSTHYYNDPNDQESISYNVISCIYKDSSGYLWIGTDGGGVNRLDTYGSSFKRYLTSDFLPSDIVRDIIEDELGNIWITTSMGVVRCDFANSSFIEYGVTNGLQSNEFSPNSSVLMSNGELVFGGANGFNIINPGYFNAEEVYVSLIEDGFTCYNSDGEQKAAEAIDGTYTLESSFNSFFIEFTVIDFSINDNLEFAYILEGYESSWHIFNAKDESIRYTNLDSGEYQLKVKATSDNGYFWPEELKLSIIIKTEFWNTLYFQLLVFGFAILMIFLFVRARTAILVSQRHKLDKEIKERTEEISKLYKRKAKLAEKLKKEMNGKDKMLRSLVHELKTPLTPMLSSASMLEQPLDKDLEKKLIHNIQIGTKNLDQRIDELLDINKAEIGRLTLHKEYFQPCDVVDEVIEYVEPMYSKRNQTIASKACESLPEIFADRGRIRQVLLNLLNNASKYTRRGGVITVKYKVVSGDIYFRVEDTGMGINKADAKNIFKMYYKMSGDTDDSGLHIGLPLSKSIIELHDGKIWYEKIEPHGSALCFYIPIAGAKNENTDNRR